MKKLLSLFLFLLALIISFVKPIEVKGEVEYETKSYSTNLHTHKSTMNL